MKLTLPTASRMRSPDFLFGVATSSFQIEGGADERRRSIWDSFCEQPGAIRDGSNGLEACDHYHRWREDIDLMASLGIDAYRFSISWPRVVRADGSADPRGLDFYRRLLDGLNASDILPFATLYHWDLPQHLEDAGGWLNRDTAGRYRDYVDVVTRALGDRVYSYATLNEPYVSATLGYETGIHAPGIKGDEAKKAAHHLLLAHGLGMQVLDVNSPDSLNGIVLNFTPAYPASDTDADRNAAALADEEINKWYLSPLLDGHYPPLLDRLSPEQAPEIRAGDMEAISHPLDYLGVNYYARGLYRTDEREAYVLVPSESGAVTDLGWEIYPEGLTDLLVDLDKDFDLPPIYIAENGAAMADKLEDGRVEDPERIEYLQGHLGAVDEALARGIDIRGYFCWSLMDNFEWGEGYSKRFGLVYVDFETQKRIMKSSAYAFRDLLRQREQRRVPAN
jgi:beta-glucosidase